MKSPARLALAAAVAIVAGAAPAMAAQTFMRADGVQGPVHHDGQPGWFKVNNFRWGSPTRPAPGNRPPRSGGGSFSFTKQSDSATTDLMRVCVQGAPIPKITIDTTATYGKKPDKYIVLNVRMTECPEEDVITLERYMMDFSSIKWTFTGRMRDKKKPDSWTPGK